MPCTGPDTDAGAVRPVTGVRALGVGHGQPAHEGGDVAILAGPQQQMEVVGHEAVRQQSHVEAGDSLLQDPLIIVEDRQSRIIGSQESNARSELPVAGELRPFCARYFPEMR
jgi:hypothetical protein